MRQQARPAWFYSFSMTTFATFDRPAWPIVEDEATTLWQFLDFFRATLAKKCDGLTDEQLKTFAVPPSTLTLLGIVRHLAEVERYWLEVVFLGQNDEPLFNQDESDPDSDFNDLESASVEVVAAKWMETREATMAYAAAHDLSEEAIGKRQGQSRSVSLRFIAVHLVEEYARHCGHADLLREVLDGATGH